jgi:hypothetical protein
MAVLKTVSPPLVFPSSDPRIAAGHAVVDNDALTKESRTYIDLSKTCADPLKKKDLLEKIYTIGMQITIPCMRLSRLKEVIDGYVHLKDFSRAHEIFQQLVGTSSSDVSNIEKNMEAAYQRHTCEAIKERSQTCTSTIVLKESLKTVLAFDAFSDFELDCIKIETLIRISQAFKRLGDTEQALDVLHQVYLIIIARAWIFSEEKCDTFTITIIDLAKELLSPNQLVVWMEERPWIFNLYSLYQCICSFSVLELETLLGISSDLTKLDSNQRARIANELFGTITELSPLEIDSLLTAHLELTRLSPLQLSSSQVTALLKIICDSKQLNDTQRNRVDHIFTQRNHVRRLKPSLLELFLSKTLDRSSI